MSYSMAVYTEFAKSEDPEPRNYYIAAAQRWRSNIVKCKTYPRASGSNLQLVVATVMIRLNKVSKPKAQKLNLEDNHCVWLCGRAFLEKRRHSRHSFILSLQAHVHVAGQGQYGPTTSRYELEETKFVGGQLFTVRSIVETMFQIQFSTEMPIRQ